MNQNTQTPLDPRQAQAPYYADDEISLIDLLNALREQYKVIATLAIAAPIVAFAATFAIPSLYQADVLIQIGRAAGAGAGAGAADIEPTSTLAQRLNSKGFNRRLSGEVDPSFSLKAVEIKNTRLLRIEGRATSPQAAEKGVEKALFLISQDHDPIVQASRQSLLAGLAGAREELKTTSAALSRINDTVIRLAGSQKQDAITSLLLTQTQSQLTDQRIALLEKISSLENLLLAQNLSNTRAVEPAQVSDGPVYPRTPLVVVIAFLAGGFMGVLIAFLRNALKKAA